MNLFASQIDRSASSPVLRGALAAAALLLVVLPSGAAFAATAAVVPTRRATKLDPLTTLKAE